MRTSRSLVVRVCAVLACTLCSSVGRADVAKFRVLEAVILPGGTRAEATVSWEYQTYAGSGRNGKDVHFYLHKKLPGYSYGNNGTLLDQHVDMENGRGIARLTFDLPPGATEGTSLVLTGRWPSTGHKWGTDSSRPGGQFTLKAGGGAINLNQAKPADLASLPGIGPALAQRVIDLRDQQPKGKLRSLNQLTAIKGINQRMVDVIAPLVTLKQQRKPAVLSVNINSAKPHQLEALPGIGPAKARAIDDYRAKTGIRLSNPNQLQRIPGIGPSLASRIAPHVKFSGRSRVPRAYRNSRLRARGRSALRGSSIRP